MIYDQNKLRYQLVFVAENAEANQNVDTSSIRQETVLGESEP